MTSSHTRRPARRGRRDARRLRTIATSIAPMMRSFLLRISTDVLDADAEEHGELRSPPWSSKGFTVNQDEHVATSRASRQGRCRPPSCRRRAESTMSTENRPAEQRAESPAPGPTLTCHPNLPASSAPIVRWSSKHRTRSRARAGSRRHQTDSRGEAPDAYGKSLRHHEITRGVLAIDIRIACFCRETPGSRMQPRGLTETDQRRWHAGEISMNSLWASTTPTRAPATDPRRVGHLRWSSASGATALRGVVGFSGTYAVSTRPRAESIRDHALHGCASDRSD